MALTKPPVLPVWAEAGDKVQPTNVELQAGWPLSNIPPARQRWNWILGFLANGIRYLTRRGISDWAADETYEIGDYSRGPDGLSYKALTQNTNKSPAANPADWERWAFSKSELAAELSKKDYKESCRFTTTGDIALAGLGTQAGGDWAAAAIAGDRILVKNQAVGSQNGIYVAAAGAWVRAIDADDGTELNGGALVPIEEGTVSADTVWMLTNDGAVTIGATALTFQLETQTAAGMDARYLDPSLFYKLDALTPAFIKTAAGTISVKAGTVAMAFGTKLKWAVDTAVTMPALTGGVDYAIYVCTDGTLRADASFTAPAGYTVNNSRMIGGFHYGLVAAGTTVAGGAFATAGNGMIWTQGDVDNIAGINKFSIWDLKFRPAAADPRGMVLVGGRTWVDIYLCSTDTATNGTSKAGTNIASHTVLPKIPAAFGGNGVTTYPSLNWWVANELARANKKRLMWEHEFVEAAFGVTENQSIDATASTYPTTQRNAGYTSKYGIEQASGHHWTWGQDSSAYSDVAGAYTYKQVNGNTGAAGSERGQIGTFGTYGLVRVILGGARTVGAVSGSRCSNWGSYPWSSGWGVGLRAACDHLQSV